MPCGDEADVLNAPPRQTPEIHTHSLTHLHLERPSLNLRDALGDDEGDAVTGTAGHLREFPAEELKAALQLLMATLDGHSLQAALVTCQETLQRQKELMTTGLVSWGILSGSPSQPRLGFNTRHEGLTSSHSAPWK